jgi:hypothetical protein
MIRKRRMMIGLGLLGVFVMIVNAIAAQPAGTITLHATSVAVGVGAQWGNGTLTLPNGKQYPFTVQGLEVGGIGVAELRAEGEVYNLDRLSDFNGVYAAAEASVAVGSGPGARTMRNEHGVVINLSSLQKGVKLTLAGEGVRIALKD